MIDNKTLTIEDIIKTKKKLDKEPKPKYDMIIMDDVHSDTPSAYLLARMANWYCKPLVPILKEPEFSDSYAFRSRFDMCVTPVNTPGVIISVPDDCYFYTVRNWGRLKPRKRKKEIKRRMLLANKLNYGVSKR